MSYCTKADIQNLMTDDDLRELTVDDDSPNPDDAKITAAIGAADEEIDSYAAIRYAVPLDPVPGRVKDIAVDVAIHQLYARRPGMEIPETVKDRYKAAVKWLDRLSKGAVALGDQPSPAPSPQTGGQVSANERIFTRGKMEGF